MLRRCLAGLAAIAILLSPCVASADEAEASLSSISEGAAREAAIQIACTSPASRRWLKGTLRDLAARRWGMLESTFRRETIDLVGDAVYAETKRSAANDAVRVLLGEPGAECSAKERRAAVQALAEIDGSETPSDVDRCLAKGLAERRRDPGCALAASVRAALEGDSAVARANLADVVAAAVFDAIVPSKLSEPQKDAVFEHIAYELREVMITEPNDETIDADVGRAFANVDLDAVRGWRCKERDLMHDLAEGAVDPQDAFCSATRADLVATKVPIELTGPTGKKSATTLDGVLVVSAAAVHAATADEKLTSSDRDSRVADAMLCALPLGPEERGYAECSAGSLRSPKGAGKFKLAVGATAWTITVGQGKTKVESADHLSFAAFLSGALESLLLREDISTLVRDKLLGDEPTPEMLRELATTALRLRRVARALDDLTLSTDRRPTILAVLDGLPSLVPRFAGAPTRPPCSAAVLPFDRMRCAAAGPLRGLIVTAENARVRDLATRTATLLGARGRSSRCTSAQGARLLAAFAANIDEPSDPLALEQIKATAPDVLRCAPDERREREDARFTFSFLPTVGLRASWNNAYRNTWGGDGFRLVPSLDVLSLRTRVTPEGSRVRAGIDVSLVDVLAPITELALRNGDLRYDRQAALWLDAVRPRIDLAFGLPSLSRHLSFGAGVSLRVVAPYRGGGDTNAPKTLDDATYIVIGTPGGAAQESFASYFEWNVAARYAF